MVEKREVLLGDTEKDIKDFLLENGHLFGDLGKSSVWFEKVLTYSNKRNRDAKKTVADALLFTEKKGVVGIEIKSRKDSTYRLNRQLKTYVLNCNYIYILVHDDHIDKVEEILASSNLYNCVGIISFTEYKGSIIAGIYKEATKNPNYSAFHALNMLHKQELHIILNEFNKPTRAYNREKGNYSYWNNKNTMEATFTKKMKKRELINNFIKRFGAEQSTEMMCELIIRGRYSPERLVKLHHFKPRTFKPLDGSLFVGNPEPDMSKY